MESRDHPDVDASQPQSQSPPSGPSDLIGGRYRIEQRIGEGHVAVTYRARDILLDRLVALKVLRPEYAADQTFLTRFEREARAAAAVDHPNVVHVYDYGAHDDRFFLVMQYIPGRDLKQVIQDDGPHDPVRAAWITRRILRGLGAIHAVGIIHRDIKPQNVLVGDDGIVRVTDFGIARAPADSALTSHGTTVGTVSYMAPEQVQGGDVSAATDLYAVGVVLFELVTGRLPFEAEHPVAVMLAHLREPPPAPSAIAGDHVSPALDAAILRAIAKDPAARYTSAGDMARAVEAALDPARADEATDQIIIPPELAAGGMAPATQPLPGSATNAALSPAQPVGGQHAPPTSPPPSSLPHRQPTRGRVSAWLAPLLVVLLALAAIGGVLASTLMDGDGDGNGNGDGDDPRLVSDGFPTQSSAAADTTSTREAASSAATRTPTATATATEPPPAATRTPRRSPTPEPTRTPRPTETPDSVNVSAPTEPPADEADERETETGESPPIVPVKDTEAAPAEPAGEAATLSFGATDWEGGYHRGDSEWYGRPWTAIYGSQSGYGQATLTASLDAAPDGEATLTLSGLDDEWSGANPIAIAINGAEIYSGPSPFTSWDGVGQGENAAWTTHEFTVPADALVAGANQITVSNLDPSANYNMPPYVLLSDASLEIAG